MQSTKGTYSPYEGITVSFAGMPASRDWISLAPIGAGDSQYVAWRYTGDVSAGNLVFATGLPSGDYEARAYTHDDYVRVYTGPTFHVNALGASATLDASTFAPGVTVNVHVAAMPGKKDWVAIAPVGSTDSQYVSWAYTGDVAATTVAFNNLPNGSYVARAYTNDVYQLLATSSVFSVSQGPTIVTGSATYNVGDTVGVTFASLPGHKDWIAIAPVGSADSSFIAWRYTADVIGGNLTFSNLPAGNYVARAYTNDVYDFITSSSAFSVTTAAAAPSVGAASDSFASGVPVRVNFASAPKHKDWVAIADANAPASSFVAWAYTGDVASGNVNLSNVPAGRYVARLFTNDVYDLVATSAPFQAGALARGTVQWASNFGLTGYSEVNSIALDPTNEDRVLVGDITGTTNFGGGVLTSHGAWGTGYDPFVARFDKNGAYRWAKSFGNGLANGISAVAIDGSGNVTVGGIVRGTLDFGGGPLTATGDADIFVAQFDSVGTHRWSKHFGVAGQVQNMNSVAVDSNNNVVIGGVAYGGLNVGGGAMSGYFIAKFSQSGAFSWSNAYNASSTASTPRIAVDGSGNVYLGATFSHSGNFGGATFTSAGGADTVVAKYNSLGAHQWSRQFSTIATSNANTVTSGIDVDAAGNVFITGSFGAQAGNAMLDFGVGALSGPDSSTSYTFLAKLDSSGAAAWSKKFVGTGSSNPATLTVDPLGRPTISYYLYSGTVDFGGGALGPGVSNGRPALALSSFDAAGNHRWSYSALPTSTAQSSSTGVMRGLAANASSIVVGGVFAGACATTCANSPAGTTLALGGKTLTAVSTADAYLFNFAP